LGTPASIIRGFCEAKFREIGKMIVTVVNGLATNGEEGNCHIEAMVKAKAKAICSRFPLY
jgi:glycine hydroxymethyltransferase|tara:strand:- start:348 stop:527 length:180 start_codon:yes stop_codon:yes gene_type:complete